MWVECMLSIRFDLEEGPVVEHVSPADALTREGQRDVVAAAFPDTNFECDFNFIYLFTMRNVLARSETSVGAGITPANGAGSPGPRTSMDVSSRSTVPKLYGSAFYRQKRDRGVPRGYVQQVIVLLSRLPYHVLHELILRVVVPRFSQCCPLSPDLVPALCSSTLAPTPTQFFHVDKSFNRDHYTQEGIIDRAMEEIRKWPPPHSRRHYELSLLYQTLEFVTPSHAVHSSLGAAHLALGSPYSPHSTSPTTTGVGRELSGMTMASSTSFGPAASSVSPSPHSHELATIIPLYSLLRSHLEHLTRMWELLISHQSIFILSDTTSCAAGVAHAVTSLIAPLRFNGKLYPHFTTKHEDLGRFRRLGKEIPFQESESLVVACTNRLLFKSFDAWHSWIILLDSALQCPPAVPLGPRRSSKNNHRLVEEPERREKSNKPGDESATSFSSIPRVLTPLPSTKLPYGSQILQTLLPLEEGGVSSHGVCRQQMEECSHSPIGQRQSSMANVSEGHAESALNRQYRIPSSSSDSDNDEQDYQDLEAVELGGTPKHQRGVSAGWGSMCSLRSPRRGAAFYVDPAPPPVAVDAAKQFHAGFTSAELKQVLSEQVQAVTIGSCEAARAEVQMRPRNYFDANFAFILNHKELTHSLVQQLEKVSNMDALGKEVTVSMQLDLLYGSGVPDGARTTEQNSGQSTTLKDFSAFTVFAQQSVADDTVRRFFRSLTTEFLRPVESWFSFELQRTASAFEWLDGKLLRERATGKAFMEFMSAHHRKVIGTSIKGNLTYATYHSIYERFSQGSLFSGYVEQLFDEKVREEVGHFTPTVWMKQYPAEDQRLQLFFSFVRVVLQETDHRVDPDTAFVMEAHHVLLRMVDTFSSSLRAGLLEYLNDQHFQFV